MGGRDQTRSYSRKESVVFLKTDEPFGGLSNMAGGYPIHVSGVRILTSEALYQVCRFPHLPDVQKMIVGQISPITAKMRSMPYRKDSRPDWEQVRVRIMRWSLRMKLANNWNTFSALLLRTGERPIVEESRKDDFWGAKVVDDGDTLVGMNVLGRLLMELREQVKQQGRDAALDVAPPDIPQFLLFGRPIEVTSESPLPQEAETREQGSLFGADIAATVETPAPPAAAPSGTTKYEAYRPVRSRWVPRVPEHWSLLRAKNFLREIDDRTKTGDETLLSMRMHRGLVPHNDVSVKRIAPEDLIGYKKAQPDELVLNRMQAGNAMFFRNRQPGLVSPDYAVFRLLRDDNPEYLGHLFRSWPMRGLFRSESKGLGTGTSGFLRLYSDRFAALEIPLPPRPEQDQIVAYLRAQDAHIARFIKAKRDLIALLTEQKLRIIDHAVTRGLDTSVHLKLSGIEWLGEVPGHWEAKPLKRWVRLNASTLGEKTAPDLEFRYVDIGSVKTGRLAKELERIRFEAAPSRARRVLRRGDTIISTVRTYLKAIWYVNEEADDLIASTGFAVLTPGNGVEPEYLGYVIQSSAFVNRVTANSIGIAYPAIAESVLGRFPIAMPPTVAEQQAIVAHIQSESAPLDTAIEQAVAEIKLIREYRDRLIADAVTGQVDLRGWRPGPDDVVSDDDLAALSEDDVGSADEENPDGED
ncbi:NADAR domain-containing protein [Luteimonas arsenica]|uniref:NADAR domain-containing protein n=1 Tax=Luteimonas arsenica TaxID=1586242 RepID=UPI001FB819FF|nr:NADAR domain-containing protein [Luteimonas arsenica]